MRAERDRIARDLHDVIARSVSAMVVQTAAAQDLVRSDPARAESVLRDVTDTGRKALVGAKLLHIIRDDADELLGLSPAPGVADLRAARGRVPCRGPRGVDLSVDERLAPLPAGIDVSAYRIAREALTNALRYGGGTATLQVSGTGDVVAIRATNPTAPHRPSMGSGLGLRRTSGSGCRCSAAPSTATATWMAGSSFAATLPMESG